ncbi:MAG: 4-hydroxy-3-methylbut-2-enyl diphosphate reductase [Candidatus Fluviicola riflensis]|nr:MAG: 4-hydroxy-3-methylbut-2-enyl diphosphate reductase [Candidatus Fluviicola riflensis]OGS79881.1 MAG: 4-hydroxy-3-methylbut-2-enyl diphosphate reductase [Candidatus Fluviicola riflensis]OGS82396.1 MAG: 4-hydroxy-3-methylbut-2-enyl diphosphate reductase [Fluviicola sp. RIFCSPHIGHO2_01_FULL_43_53]OGS88060.1 MAG: 4-hydroxy-3-methylbut-2-enyl diphosphate reductase [Fluviicola sp. RIFCSPHIGHO2_12_FULL_43_24]
MKQFEIPEFYRSPIISKVKAFRKAQDPRKKDFTPTLLDFGNLKLVIARHFGFCYGVENAIEIAYRAIAENKGKRIFLLSQMIHNPGVNEDLTNHGITFIQDTKGNQIIDWSEITADDVVIIPAFGTTLEIEALLKEKGVNVEQYNTTCPFVEKVWNRSEKLAQDQHTLVIHGKYNHEETRATFSHTAAHTQAVIVKDLAEAKLLGECITGKRSAEEFYQLFEGKYTKDFDPEIHFSRLGVINQTTMLATETQEIAEYLKALTEAHALENNLDKSFADTRDTLCYATNDNQSATLGLMEAKPDLAIVVGGYNSSNTTHLVELLEQTCPAYFIKDATEISDSGAINSFNIHTKTMEMVSDFLPQSEKPLTIAITSGASCPDATVDQVIQRVLEFIQPEKDLETVLRSIQ